MKKCTFCGEQLPDNSNFCVYCMRSLRHKVVIRPLNAEKSKIGIAAISVILAAVLLVSSALAVALLTLNNTGGGSSEIVPSGSQITPLANPSTTGGTQANKTTQGGSNQSSPAVTLPTTPDGDKGNTDVAGSPINTASPNNSTTVTPPTGSNGTATESGIIKIVYEANAQNTLCVVAGLESDDFGEALIIPETYNGMKVVGIKANAFNGTIRLKKVVVPATVTQIGEGAFRNCTYLEEVTLSEGLEEIGNYAFANCTRLKEITLPSTINTSAKYIFNGCTALESITSNCAWETEEYRLRGLFIGCTALESVVVPEGTTVMRGEMFKNCTSLKRVVLPQCLYTIQDRVFEGCTALEEINLEYVYFLAEEPFRDCVSLKSVNFATKAAQGKAEIYSNSFAGCQRLMSVALPKTLKLYADSFADCFSLGLISYAGTKNDWNNLDFVKNNLDWISGPSGDVYVRCTDGDIVYYD